MTRLRARQLQAVRDFAAEHCAPCKPRHGNTSIELLRAYRAAGYEGLENPRTLALRLREVGFPSARVRAQCGAQIARFALRLREQDTPT